MAQVPHHATPIAVAASRRSTASDDVGWSEARVERLRRLWLDEGLSASEVAAKLGVTRNAVLGKVHRLGLCNRRPARAARAPAAARTPRPQKPPRPGQPKTPQAQHREPPCRAAPLPEIGPGLVAHLEDLGPHTCHWPVGDPASESFAFCGRRAARRPYCEAHRRVAYRPGGPQPVAGLIRRFAGA
jgi:GcrA cell cycle regulator